MQNLKGTFAAGQSVLTNVHGDVLMVPTGVTTLRLTATGLDATTNLRTEKLTPGAGSWTNVQTYTSAQNNLAITAADGEQWRVRAFAVQPLKQVEYSLSAES
ncbi:hypothetical protein [Xanthomonas rydalmerensis]|uniref:Uncharacterized protein n=1 Tax=Xanthomonas rydalmerensis TaxID=3046274 RepID=A0ABZ0JLM2_9XANT|nr:hypothetical protein [Xanthomonas sp. DM-2023]WOS40690.1 hypothetical protein QN243_20230 [Xanthomonas sp. DM-2023]WOS44874.1 hypothetical protein QN242_20230 [Xanthomonas sp. DM-2023]WOS49054.1 hypothetical protein QN240_20230 [Xanthomonas sp. DM-2023]WOS53234.1 hypothetical protein QN244_20235 [Xanthomonas sp. DM-2023]WOS57417.1 hypothetical protein QN245_20230 [Xanthomonas sp. DM-2023]